MCGCRAWFVWDLVGNPEDRFSHNEAHMYYFKTLVPVTVQAGLRLVWLETQDIGFLMRSGSHVSFSPAGVDAGYLKRGDDGLGDDDSVDDSLVDALDDDGK